MTRNDTTAARPAWLPIAAIVPCDPPLLSATKPCASAPASSKSGPVRTRLEITRGFRFWRSLVWYAVR